MGKWFSLNESRTLGGCAFSKVLCEKIPPHRHRGEQDPSRETKINIGRGPVSLAQASGKLLSEHSHGIDAEKTCKSSKDESYSQMTKPADILPAPESASRTHLGARLKAFRYGNNSQNMELGWTPPGSPEL